MFANFANLKHRQRYIPMVMIAIAYSALFLIPAYRELRSVTDMIEEQSASVSLLSRRVESAEMVNVGLATDSTEPISPTLVNRILSSVDYSQSFAQSLGEVLTVLESNGVECVSAKPDHSTGALTENGTLAHHLTLLGGFQNVLSSMGAIESDISSATATEFSMTRLTPSEPCRWEIAFQFKEGQL